MVKVQIDLNEEENRKVEICKAINKIETKELAIKKMISTFYKCEHTFIFIGKVKAQFTSRKEPKIYNFYRCSQCGEIRDMDNQ